ncbi:hypothetical protein AV530_006638 [Patagioenas fasciata monilis]|uniref:Uncharacterized protein n=1 Tax=Patagioenas fasciata monilis TaxID=372326 RepID=A0A1V4KHA8_PATFA|nr:hypothetical protein AV530_006638 [Patagioenas fasciata monilis]
MDIPSRAEGYRYYIGWKHPAESTDHQPLLSITAEVAVFTMKKHNLLHKLDTWKYQHVLPLGSESCS